MEKKTLDSFVDHILTGEIMTNPVFAEDGRTYERESIIAYFKSRDDNRMPIISPLTREVMGKTLRPNIDFKRAIDQYLEEQSNNSLPVLQPLPSPAPFVESIEEVTTLSSLNDLSKYFECLDPCREMLSSTLGGWTPPCIIMIGPENTGKSTILERLALMSIFPIDDGICTRMPIHVRLRRSNRCEPPVLTVEKRATKQVVSRQVIPLLTGHVDVREAMTKHLRRNNDGSVSGIDLDHVLILQINSPRVSTIDIIDLPGVVVAATQGQPTNMAEVTRQLAIDYIEEYKARAIFLCTCRATSDSNSNIAFGLIQQLNLQAKAIGVITMCDKKATMSKGKYAVDVQGLRAMIGPDGCGGVSNIRLVPNGYVCVMNAPEEPLLLSPPPPSTHFLLDKNTAEQIFFSDGKMGDLLKSQRAGGNGLVARLDRIYSEYLTNTWLPDTILQLVNKESALKQDMQQLGQPAGDVDGLVSITQQYKPAIEQLFQQVLECIQNDMCALASSSYERLMSCCCGGATSSDGVVQSVEANHAAAARVLKEMEQTFLCEGNAVCETVFKELKAVNHRPSKLFSADNSELQFGRFSDLINYIDGFYLEEVDKIETVIRTEVERLVRFHFTHQPFSAIQIKFNNNNTTSTTAPTAAAMNQQEELQPSFSSFSRISRYSRPPRPSRGGDGGGGGGRRVGRQNADGTTGSSRFWVPGVEEEEVDEEVQPIHYGVSCDECGTNPIVGIRYKSTVRNNYDVCDNCTGDISCDLAEFVMIVDPTSHDDAPLIPSPSTTRVGFNPPHDLFRSSSRRASPPPPRSLTPPKGFLMRDEGEYYGNPFPHHPRRGVDGRLPSSTGGPSHIASSPWSRHHQEHAQLHPQPGFGQPTYDQQPQSSGLTHNVWSTNFDSSGSSKAAPNRTSVNVVVQVTTIADDVLHAIFAGTSIRLQEAWEGCSKDVFSPNEWIENCSGHRNRLQTEAGTIASVIQKLLSVIGGPSLTTQMVLSNNREAAAAMAPRSMWRLPGRNNQQGEIRRGRGDERGRRSNDPSGRIRNPFRRRGREVT